MLLFALVSAETAAADDRWLDLFDGKTLKGWRANLHPESFSVVDGSIRAHSVKDRVHLFYVGGRREGFELFKNFELEMMARGEPKSNSGIFFHTDDAVRDALNHLANGYEVQLVTSSTGRWKTGSLYDVVDVERSPVDETAWFKVRVTVNGKRIVVRLNDAVVVDYTEPENLVRPPERTGRRLRPQGGAIALQAHDPGSTFYFKQIRIRRLP